jgi:small subunit ribosomal protein S5
MAVNKAVNRAKKNISDITIVKDTIPHALKEKYKAARVMLKPAPQGSGIIAGGVVRSALEVSGIGNIVAKIYGSRNKINNIRALFSALNKIKI